MMSRVVTQYLWALLCAFACVFALPHADTWAADSEKARIGVLYPQVNEPYRAVFKAIAGGVGSEVPGSVQGFGISPEENGPAVAERLAQDDLSAVILLGKLGLDLSATVNPRLRRVVGAVLTSPEAVPPDVMAISLAPSPKLLFGKL